VQCGPTCVGRAWLRCLRDYDDEQYNRESRALVESVRHGAWTEVALLGPGDAADKAAERYRALVRLIDEAALTGTVPDRDIRRGRGLVCGWPGGLETAGVFVVDDLVGWVVGRLADAGYQRLVMRVRGSDQEHALKEVVTAAVQATVSEIGPSDGEEADRIAEQINKAFRRRNPVPLPPGQTAVLEALQAGIAGQLSVLDDDGQSGVSLPGSPVSEVAAKLTGHLVRKIQVRGSPGGPLADLADQLNHDLTHLQGQRLEGMLAQVLDWLGHGQAPTGGAAGPVGQPLGEVSDPFALEVHWPVEPDVTQPALPVLPMYVPREHDAALAEVMTAAATGTSGIAVLVGGRRPARRGRAGRRWSCCAAWSRSGNYGIPLTRRRRWLGFRGSGLGPLCG